MISNECNGCEYKCSLSHIAICTLGSPCPHQRSTPLTEQEYLQTCTTEQLAEKLWELYNAGKDDAQTHETFEYFVDEKDVVEWLKQPHTD